MGIALGLIGSLVQLAVLAGIVVLIVKVAKRRGTEDRDPESAGTVVRRLFHYALLFASLMLAAAGVIGVLGALIESDAIARDAADLALPLALTIVGAPLFIGLAIWSKSCLDSDPGEQRSIAWLFYLSAVLLVSLVAAIIGLSQTFTWVLGGSSGEADALAAACVWVVIWSSHWWIGERFPPLDDLRAQRLGGSAIGLWVGAGFLIALGAAGLTWVYDELLRTTVATTIGDDLRNLAPPAAVGAVVWLWYWVRHAMRDERTGLWNAYALLFGVLPGLMIALAAAGVLLFAMLEWAFGSPEGGAADHFAVVPATLSSIVVGGAVLAYHRDLIRRRHAEARAEIDRVYDYVVTAVGLVATGVAITMLISAGIEAIAPAPIAEGGSSEVDALLLAVTLFAVGAPLWWYFWSRVQRHAAADPVEARSPSRRLYLFISFGLGGVAAVISLITALAIALGDVLDSEAGLNTLYAIRIPLALVVTIGAVAGYHWTVFSEDRERAPEEVEQRRIRSVVVIGADRDGLGAAIEEATGTRPQIWQRTDRKNPVVDPSVVVAAVEATAGERLVVVVGPDGGLEVFPVGREG